MDTPQRLEELPFASSLRRFDGDLRGSDDFDSLHFADAVYENTSAGGARFLECAFTAVRIEGGSLRRSRLSDVWLHETRLVSADLAQTDWLDCWFVAAGLAGVQAYDAHWRRVVFQRCKFDSVNFRGARFTEVVFDTCLMRDVDFSGAALDHVSFPGSRLVEADFSKASCEHVDLRGAELGITGGHDGLRGTIVDSGQLVDLAPVLAAALGITVEDR
ncbi:MAG TPA: pentapeptide repeat-containing protein [Actinocrinis sp.]|nr:pentapeptide repeat-containing protein [Actinocrinis sp.]